MGEISDGTRAGVRPDCDFTGCLERGRRGTCFFDRDFFSKCDQYWKRLKKGGAECSEGDSTNKPPKEKSSA